MACAAYDPELNCIFLKWNVTGASDYTEDDLKAILSRLGKLKTVKIIRDTLGPSKGFGYAIFKNPPDAQKAVDYFKSQPLSVHGFACELMPNHIPTVPINACNDVQKFYADMKKAAKARNHDQVLAMHEKNKEEKEREKLEKLKLEEMEVARMYASRTQDDDDEYIVNADLKCNELAESLHADQYASVKYDRLTNSFSFKFKDKNSADLFLLSHKHCGIDATLFFNFSRR